MTQSVPSGFSREDLEALYANAPIEDQTPEPEAPTYGKQELTEDEVMRAAEEAITSIMDVCGDPIIHKVMALMICSRFVEWHNIMADKQECQKATAAWYRDAGKFQAIMDILTSISVGPDDFACS